jgi:4-amino-4-deoxy-L-arabinose transferase-like glycosyltransferase
MKKATLPLPEIGLIALTRGLGGAGIGLLAASRLRPKLRRRVGWPLLAIGAITTVPLLMDIFRKMREEDHSGLPATHK